ncbi:MAG: DNA polymerase IV [Verrucomicrobia bacterium]|nr:DNA polymerase IV [Verrucomicrobiota bacterium]
MNRTILHVDMDAFFAAVEQRDRPELRGKPVVVGSGPNERGVVSAASYEARKFGIFSAMPSREAGRRCPHAVFLPVDGKKYRAVSVHIFDILERFTPLVEGISIDEAFLDVTGSQRLFGSGPEIARKIKDAIRQETQLIASVGVAPNKFLAKLASDLNKPDGLTVVPLEPSDIIAFLAPLQVSRIWGVGTVMQATLKKFGIETIGALQACSRRELTRWVGAHTAEHLQLLARGQDTREVSEIRDREKSISREHTFSEDCTSETRIRAVLGTLVEDVGRQVRAANRFARVAHLKIRWRGFKTLTRQQALSAPCCDDTTLREMAETLLSRIPITEPVRLIGFGVSQFEDKGQDQLLLFDTDARDTEQRESLSRSVDSIRRTFGKDSIRRASAPDLVRNPDGDGQTEGHTA